jgi:dihydroorotate dehydrogenase (NAD+) catalytic subunit
MRLRRVRSLRSSAVTAGVVVGSVAIREPVLTASGTAGHAAEFQEYMNLSELGGVVVKSLYKEQWPGNPAPRVHPLPAGMINAVGLQGPGVEEWIAHDLPALEKCGATVVASIWGRGVGDYAEAARQVSVVAGRVAALEVNLSCPNLEGRGGIIAHDASTSAAVIDACRVAGLPMWAKLSPNTDRIVEIASAVVEAGAESLTLVNTVLGLAIDTETARPVLGNGGGGVSGRAIHAVALRAVYDVRSALRHVPIIGVGGISRGEHAIAMMQVGANAVQVGTASFARPDAAMVVLNEMHEWASKRSITSWNQVTDATFR